MIVLAEQKKASVRVAFIGKKEAENLTYVSADYQAVSRVGGLDENLTVYIGQGKEPLTIRNIQELSAGAAGAVKGMGIKAYEMDIRPFLEAAGVFLLVSRVTQEAFGYGDSLMIAVTGVYLGFWNVLYLLVWAYVLTAVFAGYVLIRKGFQKDAAFPFVPFLLAAYIGIVCLGGI